jgi:hypothetical protein
MNLEQSFAYINQSIPSSWDLKGALQPDFVSNALKSPFSLSNYSPNPLKSRIKPDIYAPGTHVISANPALDPNNCNSPAYQGFGPFNVLHYTKMHGPSVAAAVVSGLAALTREYLKTGKYINGRENSTVAFKRPSAAVIKALLINGAIFSPTQSVRHFAYSTNLSPVCSTTYNVLENDTGFGFVRLSNSLKSTFSKFDILFLGHNESASAKGVDQFGDPVINASSIDSYKVCVFYNPKGDVETRITLVWTDPPAGIGASNVLVNDLDLSVTFGSKTFYGNGGTSSDKANNVERIIIPAVNSTVIKTQMIVKVISTNFGKGSAQPYSLVVSGFLTEGDCSVVSPPDIVEPSPTNTNSGSEKCSTIVCQFKDDPYIAVSYSLLGLATISLLCFSCCFSMCNMFAYRYRKAALPSSSSDAPRPPSRMIELPQKSQIKF